MHTLSLPPDHVTDHTSIVQYYLSFYWRLISAISTDCECDGGPFVFWDFVL